MDEHLDLPDEVLMGQRTRAGLGHNVKNLRGPFKRLRLLVRRSEGTQVIEAPLRLCESEREPELPLSPRPRPARVLQLEEDSEFRTIPMRSATKLSNKFASATFWGCWSNPPVARPSRR